MQEDPELHETGPEFARLLCMLLAMIQETICPASKAEATT